jgi:hypothetical protein
MYKLKNTLLINDCHAGLRPSLTGLLLFVQV